MPTPSAKDRILDAALTLFNEQGSANVTTNHVAQRIKMSPGNLYYHFRNKEEIIRALFARLDSAWDSDYALEPGTRLDLMAVRHLLHVTFETMWQYRFFYRETLGLLYNDPELAAQYRPVRTRGLRDTEALLLGMIESGLLVPLAASQAPQLSALIRIVTDHWLNFKALGNDAIDPTNMQEGVSLVLSLVLPYLTPQASADYWRYEQVRLQQDAYHQRVFEDLSRPVQEEPS